MLFEIFSQRDERVSTIVTSNQPFEFCTSVLCSDRLNGARLDRFTDRITTLAKNGQSYRVRESAGRRNVPPPTKAARRKNTPPQLTPIPATSPTAYPMRRCRFADGFPAGGSRQAIAPRQQRPTFLPPHRPEIRPSLTHVPPTKAILGIATRSVNLLGKSERAPEKTVVYSGHVYLGPTT